MNERNKGKRLEKFLCDHVVFDLETTSNNIYEAKIIEIAAIKVRAGEIVDKFETLINPGEHIPHMATMVNNITDEMVKDAPKIEAILDDFLAFTSGEILVGHNITTFDLNILYDVVKKYNGTELNNDFIDTLYVARKCNGDLENYKLQTICNYYGIDAANAHRAMKDCYMTEACFKELKRAYDEHGFIKCNHTHSVSNHCMKSLQQSFLEIVADDISITTILDKHFCLTGEFAYGNREDVEKLIVDHGGICDTSVKKATDYVVVGALGSENWKQGTYGAKIKKAMEWQEKGSNVQIVSEDNFLAALNKNDSEFQKDETVMMFADITNEDEGWKRNVQNMLDELAVSLELPEKALYLAQNIGRISNNVTSYSVCIYEPEYPKIPNRKMDQTRNSVVMNIKEKKDKLELMIGLGQYESVKYENELETKILKSDPKNIHVFMENGKELVEYIKLHTEYRMKHYTSKASTFGCCSKFNVCSEAKKCVHENKLYSMACSYRKHLDSGRIFYGENRNIED